MPASRAPAAPGRSRIYEKIIRETLRAEVCESFADLVAAVKARCARYRVPYAHHEVDDALAAMGDSVTFARALEARGKTGSNPAVSEQREGFAPLTKTEAAAALAAVVTTIGPLPFKPMPAAPLVPARQVDRARAFALVVQGIRAQAAVCEALERQGPGDDSAAATTGARTAGECAPSPAPPSETRGA